MARLTWSTKLYFLTPRESETLKSEIGKEKVKAIEINMYLDEVQKCLSYQVLHEDSIFAI
jgi:hypothetical protein